jgi:hypothetical protein
MKQRKRALAITMSSVGQTRFNLYKEAYNRIRESMKQGFYLEAVTIIESLVSDRLESRMSFLKKCDFSFKTLGGLINESRKIEKDNELRALVSQNLDNWRKDRNKALHEMAKIADGETPTWAKRVEEISPVAKQGLVILRTIDKRCKKLRKLGQ